MSYALTLRTVLRSWLLGFVLFGCLLYTAPSKAQEVVLRGLVEPRLTLVSHVAPAARFAVRDIVPQSSHEQRLAGWLLLGGGILHVALTPFCFSEVGRGASRVLCVGSTAVLGTAAIALGVYFLLKGYGHAAPRRRHARLPSWLPRGLELASAPGVPGMLVYQTRW